MCERERETRPIATAANFSAKAPRRSKERSGKSLGYHQEGDGEFASLFFSLPLPLSRCSRAKGKNGAENGESRVQDGDGEREKTGTGDCKKKFTIDLQAPSVPCRVCVATAAFSLEL